MIIIDLPLLERFRSARKCEYCGKATPAGCEAAHISAKGMGGGKRVDIAANLMSMCTLCHHLQHLGNRDAEGRNMLKRMWKLAAAREGYPSAEVCEAVVREIQRRDKSEEWRKA